MVMLHLVMQLSKKPLPVICWREPWFPWKQTFANRIIREWNLDVYDYAPSRIELCESNGRIDVINYYQTGPLNNPHYVALARGTERPEQGAPWLCGLETFLTRPVGTFDFKWDLMFHGHKSCDIDPCSGQVPLRTDIMMRPGAGSSVFPLRSWSDEEVFAYIEKFDVPFDETRYKKDPSGNWFNISNKENNPDYYHTCFACCDRRNEAFVFCPKLKLEINNISGSVVYNNPSAAYCGLREGE